MLPKIVKLGAITFSTITLSIMILSIIKQNIIYLVATLSINDTQHNNTWHNNSMSLCWVLLFLFYAKWQYAEYKYAECCGAIKLVIQILLLWDQIFTQSGSTLKSIELTKLITNFVGYIFYLVKRSFSHKKEVKKEWTLLT